MSSTLNQSGLTIQSKTSITADLVAAYQAIYGADISVDSNSPDGQLIGIFSQAVSDFLELLQDAYNSMAIDTSYGQRLDQLVALNGISRQAGTYTQAYVSVTSTQALTLPGQDQTASTPFTVEDEAGNQFQLAVSYTFSGAATTSLLFHAVDIGNVPTTANTITNIVTATAGISTVNNPSTASDLTGVDEETDAQLKVRHAQSLKKASIGPSDAIEAELKDTASVVDAYVVENNTGSPVNGVPAYSVWAIVNGGASADIAAAIYAKKSPGCGMKGSTSFAVTRPNGSIFTAQWDAAIAQSLYIKFSIIWKGAQTMSNADIGTALAQALVYKLGENPSIGDIVTAMASIAPTAIVTINSATQGVSTNGSTWESMVQPTDAQHYFTVSAANITVS